MNIYGIQTFHRGVDYIIQDHKRNISVISSVRYCSSDDDDDDMKNSLNKICIFCLF